MSKEIDPQGDRECQDLILHHFSLPYTIPLASQTSKEKQLSFRYAVKLKEMGIWGVIWLMPKKRKEKNITNKMD